MAEVIFKKGLSSDLPSSYEEGCFYITTDDGAIYVDVSSQERVYLNDPQKAEEAKEAANNAQTDIDAVKADYIKASEMVALTNEQIDALWNEA